MQAKKLQRASLMKFSSIDETSSPEFRFGKCPARVDGATDYSNPSLTARANAEEASGGQEARGETCAQITLEAAPTKLNLAERMGDAGQKAVPCRKLDDLEEDELERPCGSHVSYV